MKYFTLLMVMVFSVTSLYSQWQLQNSGTSENLNDVDILDYTFPNSAVVVGDNGIILKTTNNGDEWEAQNSGTTNHLNAVSFSGGDYGIAVGNEVICLTTDGGESWSDSSIKKNAISVSHFFSFDFGWNILIGCDDGTIISFSDLGNTWIDTILTNEPVFATGMTDFGLHVSPAIIATNLFTAHTYLQIGQSSIWKLFNNPLYPGDTLTCGELNWNYQYLIGLEEVPGQKYCY